ncbi:hypothetical protein DAI22_12g222800 [Oryza sativa Japonica Group]|nr:hypothetical protein DAI22_12g222800 [Oryza sativa Japonica Group]
MAGAAEGGRANPTTRRHRRTAINISPPPRHGVVAPRRSARRRVGVAAQLRLRPNSRSQSPCGVSTSTNQVRLRSPFARALVGVEQQVQEAGQAGQDVQRRRGRGREAAGRPCRRDILRRLPLRSLAAARAVCHAWRAIVDEHSLTTQAAALLPNHLRGLFVCLNESCLHGFFARPSPPATIPGIDLDYDLDDDATIEVHCNGLLLLDRHIVNPATRQWMRLPPVPPYASLPNIMYGDRGLVFDPAASPHYDVLWMPYLILHRLPAASLSDQWPPSPFILHVFSSTTGRWEEKSFLREGDATMGTMADVSLARVPYHCKTHSVYLRGALYMHCQNDCVIKITLNDHKYRVIRLPGDSASNRKTRDPFLGKSKDRVCYVLVTGLSRLQIWLLNETSSSSSSSSSYDDNEWVLKHGVDLGPIIQSYPCNHGRQQWIWHNADTKQDKTRELPAVNDMEEFEWAIDKDSDDIISGANESIHHNGEYISAVLGFHPFKDIVFLHDTNLRVVAYDYNKAKVQDLGMMFLYHNTDRVVSSFPYTPCWIRDLPGMHYG